MISLLKRLYHRSVVLHSQADSNRSNYSVEWSGSIQRSAFAFTFNTVSVFPNIPVQRGDNLLIRITSNDKSPYCHLEYRDGEMDCSYSRYTYERSCKTVRRKRRHTLFEQAISLEAMPYKSPLVGKLEERKSNMKFAMYIE
jgi:hypothetical protein